MRRLVAILAVAWSIAHPITADEHLRLAPPVRGAILRHFEPPPTEFSPGHRGIDMASEVGSPVRAAGSGTVTFAGQVGGRLFLTISHGELRSTYSFLSALLVKENDLVARDQIVARSGPGHEGSEAPHLHFGIRRGDVYLDPEPFLVDTLRAEPWRVLRLIPS